MNFLMLILKHFNEYYLYILENTFALYLENQIPVIADFYVVVKKPQSILGRLPNKYFFNYYILKFIAITIVTVSMTFTFIAH